MNLRIEGFKPVNDTHELVSVRIQTDHLNLTSNYLDAIDEKLRLIRNSFFDLGKIMLDFKTHMTDYKHDDNMKIFNQYAYYINDVYVSGAENIWLYLLEVRFNMKKTNVYRYIQIYEKFGNNESYENYKLSQLQELLSIREEALDDLLEKEMITEDTTVKDIRTIKKNLKDGKALNHQEAEPAPEEPIENQTSIDEYEEPTPVTKIDLSIKYKNLEKANTDLYEENQLLKQSLNSKTEVHTIGGLEITDEEFVDMVRLSTQRQIELSKTENNFKVVSDQNEMLHEKLKIKRIMKSRLIAFRKCFIAEQDKYNKQLEDKPKSITAKSKCSITLDYLEQFDKLFDEFLNVN